MSETDIEDDAWECAVCEQEFNPIWIPDEEGESGEFDPLPAFVIDEDEVCDSCWAALPEVFRIDVRHGEISLDEILSIWRVWRTEKD